MTKRLVYLDNIKVFLIAYVITAHITASYGAIGGGNWYYIEATKDILTKAAFMVYDLLAYSFLMAMFIFIAGYFTPASYERKGFVRYLIDRTVKLLIPLLIYYFLIGPLARYISMCAKGYEGSFFHFLGESYQAGIYGYLGVMWFIVTILVFSYVYAGFRYLFPRGLMQLRTDKFPSDRNIVIFIVIVGLASFLMRMVFPVGGGFAGSRPLGSLVLFGTAFLLGTVASRYQWLDKLEWKKGMNWFWVLMLLTILPVILFMIQGKPTGIGSVSRPGSVMNLIYSYWEVVKSVGTGMMVVVVFRRYFNKPGKLQSALSRSVFAAFFIHPLICMLTMYPLAGVALHPLIKFIIVAPVALTATFTVALLMLRIPLIRKMF